MRKSVLTPIIFALVFIAGCGAEVEESKPGVPGATDDRGTVVDSDDPCEYLRNIEYQAFGENESLNFTFDVPIGWTHQRGSSEMHGFVGANPEVRNIYIEYLVSPAMRAEMAEQVRGASMTQHEPIEVGGETVKVWVKNLREDGVSNVALTLSGPDGGARDTILRFRTLDACPFEDLEALRNHVVASVRQR